MSRIEKIIDEIEDYIEDCKSYPLSNSKIVVNKEELTELLEELRLEIPEEVSKYQKVISNQDAILNQARSEADTVINEANKLQAELVDEHEIMQKAYANANEVIENAKLQAEQIINNATNDANNMKRSLMKYSDDMLSNLDTIVLHMMENSRQKFDSFYASLENNHDIISGNRNELSAANQDN